VVGLADFGAVIEIDGATGLAHISELSWRQIRHPREVLDMGDEVDVYVLDLDPERNRISLSMKHLQPNPWEGIEERYYIGDSIEGEVVNVVDFGAFVQVEPGVEGLIHTSEMGQYAGDPREVLSIGEKVMARIIHLDPDDHRMGLHLLDIDRPEGEEAAESETEAEPAAAEAEAEASAEQGPTAEVGADAGTEQGPAAEADEVEAEASAEQGPTAEASDMEAEANVELDTTGDADEVSTTEAGLGAEEPEEPGLEEPMTTTPPVEGGVEVEDELHTAGHEAIEREEPAEVERETAEVMAETEAGEKPVEAPVT
jgi:predicted RNA-binding protein with RPS1 domain